MYKAMTMYLCHKTLEICLMRLTDNPVCITAKGPARDRTYQGLRKKKKKNRATIKETDQAII